MVQMWRKASDFVHGRAIEGRPEVVCKSLPWRLMIGLQQVGLFWANGDAQSAGLLLAPALPQRQCARPNKQEVARSHFISTTRRHLNGLAGQPFRLVGRTLYGAY